MRVVFGPRHSGTFSSENFSIFTAGGNRLTLNLQGTAVGPQVTLSCTSFNFGNVPAGQAPSRVLYLQNHSEVRLAASQQRFAGSASRTAVNGHNPHWQYQNTERCMDCCAMQWTGNGS